LEYIVNRSKEIGRLGEARRGLSWYGVARQAKRGVAWRVWVGRGEAGQARRGLAWQGQA